MFPLLPLQAVHALQAQMGTVRHTDAWTKWAGVCSAQATAGLSGRENEPQWSWLGGSIKTLHFLIFRSCVRISKGQGKKEGFRLAQRC